MEDRTVVLSELPEAKPVAGSGNSGIIIPAVDANTRAAYKLMHTSKLDILDAQYPIVNLPSRKKNFYSGTTSSDFKWVYSHIAYNFSELLKVYPDLFTATGKYYWVYITGGRKYPSRGRGNMIFDISSGGFKKIVRSQNDYRIPARWWWQKEKSSSTDYKNFPFEAWIPNFAASKVMCRRDIKDMNPTYDGNTTKNIIIRPEVEVNPLEVYPVQYPLKVGYSFGFAVFVKYGAITDWNYGYKRISTVSMYRIAKSWVKTQQFEGAVIPILMNKEVEYKASGI